jgi:glutathione S-transferase
MKLFYTPGACSLSPHIALHEAGLTHEIVKVNLQTQMTETGQDFRTINSKGQVPALMLDGGELLTEGPVIVQFIADKAPAANLAPPKGTIQHYRMHEWLNFTSSELHKNFGPLFNLTTPDEQRTILVEGIVRNFTYANSQLASDEYLMGRHFTVADGYLFVMLTWANLVKIDLSGMINLVAFHGRVAARPSVQAALKAEGAL